MKTGVIVYVAQGENTDEDFDSEEVLRRLNLNADRVQVVSSKSEDFDVMYAWWFLMVKGMRRITCVIAEAGNHTELTLTARELVLCGG
jgi:hypothetical protein